MPRVVHLLGTAGSAWGGMERHAFDLVEAQAAAGNEIHIVADSGYASRVPADVEFHALNFGRSRRNPLLWWQCRCLLKSLKPDVVHAQGGKAAALLSAQSGWLQHAGCVCVGTVHGIKSDHKAYARLDAVVAVSAAIAAQLKHPRVEVITNGIAPRHPDPDVLADCRAQRVNWPGVLVLAIGRLVPVKGYDVLLGAWPTTADAHLLILGDGSEREALQQMVMQRGLQKQVSFAGHSTAVTEWLHVADAMVISSHREGFAYVCIEALQAECPVLSTDVGIAAELLPARFLAMAGNVESLTSLLTRELGFAAALREAQASIFSEAKAGYTLIAMAERTLLLYRSLHQSLVG